MASVSRTTVDRVGFHSTVEKDPDARKKSAVERGPRSPVFLDFLMAVVRAVTARRVDAASGVVRVKFSPAGRVLQGAGIGACPVYFLVLAILVYSAQHAP